MNKINKIKKLKKGCGASFYDTYPFEDEIHICGQEHEKIKGVIYGCPKCRAKLKKIIKKNE